MAVKIIASRNEGMKDGKNYMRAELVADSVSDLTVEGISNYENLHYIHKKDVRVFVSYIFFLA